MLNEEEAIKALVYDNVNVTEKNPLKELMKIIFQLCIYIVIAYFLVFQLSGFFIKNLSISQQIWLENAIANTSSVKTIEITDLEKERLLRAKNLILENDFNFPKTSKLDIGIINHEEMNALCYPNGNIYITDTLYKHLDTDEKLVFVIAHEMAHYKNRDHLMNLRKNLASNFVILSFAIFGSDISRASDLVSASLDLADIKYSKRKEALADKYAAKILKNIYGNVNAGIEVINILNKGNYGLDLEFLSTHPSLEKRILYLRKIN